MDSDLTDFLAIPACRVHRFFEVDTGPLHELLAGLPSARDVSLLDSAREPGRYSYLAIGADLVVSATCHPAPGRPDQTHVVVERNGRRWQKDTDPFSVLRQILSLRGQARLDGADTQLGDVLVSGAIGYIGYELGRSLERLSELTHDRPSNPDSPPDLCFPDLRFAFSDALIVRDERAASTRLSVIGRGETEADAQADAKDRARELSSLVASLVASSRSAFSPRESPRATGPVLSSHDRSSYERMVDRVKEAIASGEAFEVCVTQQLSVPWGERQGHAVYSRLRTLSPAAYAAFLRFGEVEVMSASPELFLSLGLDGVALSRPIKGTRPRGATPEEDRALLEDLESSVKDRAENVMIVDLVRNDFGRVSSLASVTAPELCSVEAHPTVFQLVSTVRGSLGPGADGLDLIRACFPGGSMTGAPKIEAMKIIETLEPVERGVYSGALGYLDDRGSLSLSIVIRTLVRAGDQVTLGVGGAVVSDSSSAAEYDESLVKARAPLLALGASLEEPTRSARGGRVARPTSPRAPGAGGRTHGSRVLIIDHYDSFTYNLAQLVGKLTRRGPTVVRCDEYSPAELIALEPTHLILSPGPGRGDDPDRLGVSFELIREFEGPVLGVCLGHQAIGHVFGATVTRAPAPMHGKASAIHHRGEGLYSGWPSPFPAMRYHSLVVSDLPSCLIPDAWTSEGVVMGMRHRDLPIVGVQFHPESVGTPLGEQILGRFLGARRD